MRNHTITYLPKNPIIHKILHKYTYIILMNSPHLGWQCSLQDPKTIYQNPNTRDEKPSSELFIRVIQGTPKYYRLLPVAAPERWKEGQFILLKILCTSGTGPKGSCWTEMNASSLRTNFHVPEGTMQASKGRQPTVWPSYDVYEPQWLPAWHNNLKAEAAACRPWW